MNKVKYVVGAAEQKDYYYEAFCKPVQGTERIVLNGLAER